MRPTAAKPREAAWQEISSSSDFRNLVRAKLRIVVPATLFFIVYYFALPVLVGYAPQLMERKIIWNINIAYVFALSQFFVAWGIAALYLRAASRFDSMAKSIVNRERTRGSAQVSEVKES
jgi:uncharacterized membrane protein (DUF485 family)